jgi:hypothetical protein
LIREATLADIPELVIHGKRWHGASHWPVFAGYVPEDFAANIEATIASPDGLVLVSGDDVITGVICVVFGRLYFNNAKRIALESYWFSDNPKTGIKLLKAAEKRAGGMPFVLGSQDNSERTTRVYGCLGYAPFGANFVKGL